MVLKSYTIIVVPEDGSPSKNYRLIGTRLKFYKYCFGCLVGLFALAALASGYLIYRTVNYSIQHEKTAFYRDQLKTLSEKFKTVSAEMDEIRGFNRKIRVMANL